MFKSLSSRRENRVPRRTFWQGTSDMRVYKVTYVDRFTPFSACTSDQKSVRLRDDGVVPTVQLSGKNFRMARRAAYLVTMT